MTFTVGVERKSPNEQFEPKDIKFFHQECGGGEIIRRMAQRSIGGFDANDATHILM
jgi:hypothetical protein